MGDKLIQHVCPDHRPAMFEASIREDRTVPFVQRRVRRGLTLISEARFLSLQ